MKAIHKNKYAKLWLVILGTPLLILLITYATVRFMAPPYEVKPAEDLLADGVAALPLPEGKEETFVPQISIDPNNLDHLIAVAMYGNRFAHRSDHLHRWRSMDGGKTWSGARLPMAAYVGQTAAYGATSIGGDGTEYYIALATPSTMIDDLAALHLGKMAGEIMGMILLGDQKETPEQNTVGVISAVQGDSVSGEFNAPVIIRSPKFVTPESPWIAADASKTSPHQGNVYAAWMSYGENTKNGFRSDGAASYIAVSNDKGRTYSAPVKIGDDDFLISVSTRPDGTVDLMLPSMTAATVLHRFSRDGGKTFSKAQLVSGPSSPNTLRGYPSMATKADGSLLACWTEGGVETLTRVKCASEQSGKWSNPTDLVPNIAKSAEMGLPSVAANDAGLWVLAYKSDTKTEVILYRSIDNGTTFQPYRVLGTRNFGKDEMCLASASDLECRLSAISRQFIPGEHVSLTATGRRVAAAFVLPRSHDPLGFANTYVRVIDA